MVFVSRREFARIARQACLQASGLGQIAASRVADVSHEGSTGPRLTHPSLVVINISAGDLIEIGIIFQ